MTSPVSKRQQEAAARKEIAKRRKLRDESESDNSSGSEVKYNITISDESPVRTTRAKSKAQEAAAATTSLPQSDEGSAEADFDGDNPPVDTSGKGNDDADKSGEDDTNAEESGDKDSAAEESNEQEEDSGITPEARIFEGYNMYWMAKTPGKYSMEMVREFYANHYCTLEKKASSKTTIKKAPVLDYVRVRVIPVDILERIITRVLMGGDFTVPTRTTEYDYRMEAMKGIRKLSTEDKMFHFQWMDNIMLKRRRE
ncbi:hypothetical protein HAX54_015724 [Datura stramonium]|uniref:Uncharacterized protein n=1 Tax=Datura stramonium TaxID=4076 RepID=A0ABS8UHR5_DATST|nr:hypothetical protein [Datura stramonium]